jgi:hypothetical protein
MALRNVIQQGLLFSGSETPICGDEKYSFQVINQFYGEFSFMYVTINETKNISVDDGIGRCIQEAG